MNPEQLHAYQWAAVFWILTRPSCALWMEMGLGKTVSTLTALRILLADFAAGKVLIVAPLRVALSTWSQEIAAWSHTCDLVHVQLAGLTPAQRKKALKRHAHVYLVNRELLPWLRQHYGDAWPFDTVVLDEASSFKAAGTNRFKAMRWLVNKGLVRRVIELTGTPGDLQDLWAQLYLLDRGERLERTYTQFQARYFLPVHHVSQKRVPYPGADATIRRAIGDVCLSLRAKDYLELPERVVVDQVVQLPAKAREVYRQLERDFLADIDGQEVAAFNAAAITGKLLQAANGQVYAEDGTAVDLHQEKLDALAEILEACAGEPVLLAYSFRSDVPRIRARFPQAQLLDKDPETLARFNRQEIPLLIGHPASMGHGLNMARGSCVLVFFGLPWSLELYQQTIARLHRQGQERPVRVIRLVAQDTAEDQVRAALSRKHRNQEQLLDELRQAATERTRV